MTACIPYNAEYELYDNIDKANVFGSKAGDTQQDCNLGCRSPMAWHQQTETSMKQRIESGGKARRVEYIAGPGGRGGGTLPTLYRRSEVVAGSRLRT